MAGNSQRQGARRKQGNKKERAVGSGGQRKRGLEGKGPTPKAKDRPGHVAHQRTRSERNRKPDRKDEKALAGEMVLGRNAVFEALTAGIPATEVLVAQGVEQDRRLQEILTAANRFGVKVREISREEIAERAGGLSHQGVGLVVPPYEYAAVESLLARSNPAAPGLLVMLDGVTDPRNLGAIARSTLAFGGAGIILPSRRSVGVTAAAWRTSAGALARLPVAQVTNLVRTIEAAKAHRFTVVGLAGESDAALAAIGINQDPVLLVVGGEGKGLRRLVRENCDFIAGIPISHQVESLNASVAAGIALYEVQRARQVVAGSTG